MTVVPVPCPTQTAPSLAPAHLHSPPAGGPGGVTHFADGEIEAQSSHSSMWQGQGPELCVSLSLPRAPRTRCEGEAGCPLLTPHPPTRSLGEGSDALGGFPGGPAAERWVPARPGVL